MAQVGDTCVSIGNADWFRGDSVSVDPVAILPNDVLRGSIGNTILVSGRSSYSDDQEDILYYEWSIQGPSGYSPPENIDEDTEEIRIDLDVLGEYIVRLSVTGASGGCSNAATTGIYAFSSASPHHEGTALDMSFLWQLLPTLWSKIEYEQRLKIELFWRGLSQLLGAAHNDAMAVDVSKSLMHMSSLRAKRLHKVEMTESLREASFRIWPVYALTASRIARDVIEVTSGLEPLSAPNQYIDILGQVVSDNTLKVEFSTNFQPYAFDVDAELTLQVGAQEIRRVYISSVIDLGGVGAGMLFTLSSPVLPIERTGEIIRLKLKPRTELTALPILVSQGSSERLILASLSSNGEQHILTEGYLDDGEISSAYTSAVIEYAHGWERGIRRGDILTAGIREVISGASIGVDLEVSGIVRGDTTDLISVSPLSGGSFTQLLDDVCAALLPDVSDASRDIRAYVEASVLPRIAGKSILSGVDLFIPLSGQIIQIRCSIERILRRTATRTAPEVRELSVLREFIEIHPEDPNGEYIITEGNRALFLGRRQLTLLENNDFFVYPSGLRRFDISYEGQAYLKASHVVDDVIGKGDLLLDTFSSVTPRYTVTDVSGDRIFVTPIPKTAFDARPMRLETRTSEGWVFFEENTLPYPSVEYLWAEAATIEDYVSLEQSYGEIVDLTYAQWRRLNTRSSYIDVIRAMFIGYIQGPSISNLESAVSAVLGAPYTSEDVIIRDVTEGFRVIDGVTYAKVIAEVISEDGEGLGLFSDFLVPRAADHALSEMLRTTVSLSPGVIIRAGKSISKVVSVVDHALSPHTVLDRHTFSVRLASGAVSMSTEAVSLITRYINAVKPAHTRYTLEPVHYVSDDIDIESSMRMNVIKELFDTSYGLHGTADVLDDYIPGINRVDTRPFIVLSTWFPTDGVITLSDEQSVLTSDFGGFVNQPSQYTLPFQVQGASYYIDCRYDQGAWIRVGDAVTIRGQSDAPVAIIEEITDDNKLKIAGDEIYWFTQFSDSADNVPFIIVRFIDDLLLDAQIETEANTNQLNIIELGARASNVGRGDIVYFNTTYDVPRPISRMSGTRAVVESRGYRALSADALDLNSKIQVRRPLLRPKHQTLNLNVTQSTHYSIVSPVSTSGIQSIGMLGLQVGDLVQGTSPVIAVLQDQSMAIVEKLDLVEGDHELEVTYERGVEGPDALDLHKSGVRSSVTIIVKPNPEPFPSIGDSERLIVPTGSLAGIALNESVPGDIIILKCAELPRKTLLNVGEGEGVYRVLEMSATATEVSIKLNVDLRVVGSMKVVVYPTKQARLEPIVIRQDEV